MLPKGCCGRAGEARRGLGGAADHCRRIKIAHLAYPPQGQAIAKTVLFSSIRCVRVECSKVVDALLLLFERLDPAIILLSFEESAFCFPEDPGRWRGSSGEAAEGVSRGMKRILRAWRAARKALLFEGFRGLWDRIRCGRESGPGRLPRLGSRVRIPSPDPILDSSYPQALPGPSGPV